LSSVSKEKKTESPYNIQVSNRRISGKNMKTETNDTKNV